MIAKLREILGKDNPVVLEIGCYKGQDTKIFLDAFPGITIYCFEPDPVNVQLFQQYIGNDPRCSIVEIAISDIDGETVFHSSSGPVDEPLGDMGVFERKASGSLRLPKVHLQAHPWCKFTKDLTVQSARLDTWRQAHDLNNIDLIWADVNGAESSLIAGGLSTLVDHTDYFYTEFSPNVQLYEDGINKQQILGLLPEFEEVLTHKNNVLLRNKKRVSS